MALALTVLPNSNDHVVLTTPNGERVEIFVRSRSKNEKPISLAITAPKSIKINRSKIQARIDAAQPHHKQ